MVALRLCCRYWSIYAGRVRAQRQTCYTSLLLSIINRRDKQTDGRTPDRYMDLHRILRTASIITIACEIRRKKSRSRSDIYSLQLELISTTIYCHCNIMLLYSNRFNVLSEQSSNSRCRCGVIVAVVLQRCLAAECARCSAASSASVDARYDDVSVPFRVLVATVCQTRSG